MGSGATKEKGNDSTFDEFLRVQDSLFVEEVEERNCFSFFWPCQNEQIEEIFGCVVEVSEGWRSQRGEQGRRQDQNHEPRERGQVS